MNLLKELQVIMKTRCDSQKDLNDYAQGCLEGEHGPDIFSLKGQCLLNAIADLRAQWPKYISWCDEEYRD